MQVLKEKPLCFEIDRNIFEKNDRFDTHFSHPNYILITERLEKSPFNILTLKKISDQIVCGSTPKDYDPLAEKGILFLKTINVQDGILNLENKNYISEESHNKRKYGEVRKNDILMTIIGANEEVVGRVVLIRDDIIANINQNIAKIRVNEDVLPGYVEVFLLTGIGRSLIHQVSRTATRVNLNLKEVESIRIPVPPIYIQERIIKILTEARKTIDDNLNKVIKIKKNIYNIFMNNLNLFLPDGKSAKTFETKLEERMDVEYYNPKYRKNIEILNQGKYELKTLSDISIKIFRGLEPGSKEYMIQGDILFLRVQNINNRKIEISSTSVFLNEDYYKKYIKLQPHKNDVLVSKDGTIGSSVVYENYPKKCIISSGVAIIETNQCVDPHYLSFYLNTRFFKLQALRESYGSVIKHLSLKSLKSTLVPIPNLDTQLFISKKIQEAYSEIDSLKRDSKEILLIAKEKIENIIFGDKYG